MAVHQMWNQLPTKGDLSGSLTSIRQAPDELFQEFVVRLLKSGNRIFGDSLSENPFVTQLAYENANAACRTTFRPHKGQTDLAWYICLCLEIGSSYNQGLAISATFQGTTVQGIFSQ